MPAPQPLAVGRTVRVTMRFEYTDGVGVLWELRDGDRLVLLARRKDDWQVRAGGLTFNLSAAMLARVTATEGK